MTTRHPDFDALSAHLDGEAPEWGSHVADCATCASMASRIRATSALVATPVPPMSPAVREQALSRALDSFSSRETHREPVEGVGIPGLAAQQSPRALQSTPGVGTGAPVSSGRRPARWREGSGVWVGLGSAAAVLVAFVLGVGFLAGGGDDGTTVASGPPPSEERTATALADSAESGSDTSGAPMSAGAGDGAEGAGGIDGGDLGEIADSPALAARAGPVLAQRDAAGREAAPAAVAGGQGLSGEAPGAAAGPVPKAIGTRPCEMEARTARTDLGTVVYFATGRVGGTPVVVLGFAPGPAPAPVTLLALAQAEGCRVVLEAAGP